MDDKLDGAAAEGLESPDLAAQAFAALASRDLEETAWAAVNVQMSRLLEDAKATTTGLFSGLRLLHGIQGEGAGSALEREQLATVALLYHGILPAPEDAAGWAHLEALLEPETLADLKAWPADGKRYTVMAREDPPWERPDFQERFEVS